MNILFIEHEAEGYDGIYDDFLALIDARNSPKPGKFMQTIFPLGRKIQRFTKYNKRMRRIKATPKRKKIRRQ